MSPRIPDTHTEAWDLLPWLANGRLTAGEREWVEAHVHGCAECRTELGAQRALAAALREAGTTPAVAEETAAEQRSFDKLWARIDAAESAAAVARPPMVEAPRRASRTVRWLAAAVVIQGIGLALFGFDALRAGDPEPGFRVVTSEAPLRTNAPTVRLVFEPATAIEQINTLLAHQGLSIVSGPGLSGNFTAELSADAIASGASAESVAAVLARDPHVSFAQPVVR